MAVLVGKKAPNFTATAVMANNSIEENFNLYDQIRGKKCVLFFYPLNFTFVCPSELIAFHNKIKEFEARNVVVIAVSVDSQFSHLAYKNTPISEGGIGKVAYPLVADLTKSIATQYDVLCNDSVAYRGLFLIDEEQNIRHQLVNDLPLGRNIDEALRVVDALAFHQEHGEVCPANWNTGKEGMKASPDGVKVYLAKNASNL